MNLNIGYLKPSSSFFRSDKEDPRGISSVLEEITGRSDFMGIGVKDFHVTPLDGLDVLIIPWGLIGNLDLVGEKAGRLKSFVAKGGICWIMHQNTWGWYEPVFPPHLKPVRIKNENVEADAYFPSNRLKYVCPWIVKKSHPLWNMPFFIDEGDFLDWEVDLLGTIRKSAGTHVVYVPKGWDILAGYVDEAVRLEDRGALVLEAKFGKGCYFWTQILPAECAFKKHHGIERETWTKLFHNVFAYFENRKRSKIFEIELKPIPWAVCSNESVRVKIKSQRKIKSVDWEICSPSGKVEKIRNTGALSYKPGEGGTYEVRSRAVASDKATACGRTYFKSSCGLTPFRFVFHTHYNTTYTPINLAMLSAYAKKEGVDAVFLAEGLFYGDEDMFCRIEDAALRLIDNPAVRIFHGEEVHHMHQYNKKEGAVHPECNDTRRHAVSLGCESVYPYSPEFWEWEDVHKIHAQGGLAVAAHPGIQPWWTQPGKADDFEGFEFSGREGPYWDAVLKKGGFPTGMVPCDIDYNYFTFANIIWLDERFSQESVLNGILRGRVCGVTTSGKRGRREDCGLWFDVNGQIPGGVLYAVDSVALRVRAKSPFRFSGLLINRNGNAAYRTIKLDRKSFEIKVKERLPGDLFYRIELKARLKGEEGWFFANPVFVKKVQGPRSGYFYFQNRAERVFDKEKKRYMASLTQVERVRFAGGVWEIIFKEPGEGKLFLGGAHPARIILDGRGIKIKPSKCAGIPFGKGRHAVKIEVV